MDARHSDRATGMQEKELLRRRKGNIVIGLPWDLALGMCLKDALLLRMHCVCWRFVNPRSTTRWHGERDRRAGSRLLFQPRDNPLCCFHGVG
jgi:hypothetical protein